MLQNPYNRRWRGLTLMAAVLIGLLTLTTGCNPLNLLGGINFNIVIPLGLDGDGGLLDLSGDNSTITPDDGTTDTPTPPVTDPTITNGTTS